MKPYVGAVVLAGKRAAIITHVHDDTFVDLSIFEPGNRALETYAYAEYNVKWKWIEQPAATTTVEEPEHPNTGFNGLPWGFHP
jgi:hypothetical protein